MENNIYIIASIILTIYIIFILFLYLLNKKIDKLEVMILENFKEKNNYIPSIFDITKDTLNKHAKIFEEILILRKKDFTENNFYSKLNQKINTNKLIHNQLNFIFTVCNKHPKLNKNFKFLFIKDKILEKSLLINNKLEIYKKIIIKLNYMINIKNITIIGLLLPIKKK